LQSTTSSAPWGGRIREISVENREFLSPAQAAELLGVTEYTMKVWLREKAIPSVKIRGTRRIRRRDIDRLFD